MSQWSTCAVLMKRASSSGQDLLEKRAWRDILPNLRTSLPYSLISSAAAIGKYHICWGLTQGLEKLRNSHRFPLSEQVVTYEVGYSTG